MRRADLLLPEKCSAKCRTVRNSSNPAKCAYMSLHTCMANKHIDMSHCGYCGRDTRCGLSLEKGSTKGSIIPASNCPLYTKFNIGAAQKSGVTCSNRPIECPLCTNSKVFVWKYGMEAHYQELHPTYACPEEFKVEATEIEGLKRLPPSHGGL